MVSWSYGWYFKSGEWMKLQEERIERKMNREKKAENAGLSPENMNSQMLLSGKDDRKREQLRKSHGMLYNLKVQRSFSRMMK